MVDGGGGKLDDRGQRTEDGVNDLNAAHCAASPAVYSIFTGRKPYLDEYLAQQGKLMFIDTVGKVGVIGIERRVGVSGFGSAGVETFVPRNPLLAAQVADQLISLAGA